MSNLDDRSWILSKSSFIRGRQCVKSLYLHTYKRELKDPPTSLQTILFKKGRNFESQFRKVTFPNGIDLSLKFATNFALYEPYTHNLLNRAGACVIFEAGIISQGVLVLVDVLTMNEDGNVEIFEIKNSTQIKGIFLWDVGLQYYIAKQALGSKLVRFNLVLKGKNHSFKVIDIGRQAEKKEEQIRNDIALFSQIIRRKEEPIVKTGTHCKEPYHCDFFNYCKSMK